MSEQTSGTMDQLAHIVEAKPQDRATLVEDFFRAHARLFRRIGWTMRRRYALGAKHREDVEAIVMEVAVRLVDDIATGRRALDSVGTFAGLLQTMCPDKVRAYAHSELGHAPASGMQGTLRRRAVVEAQRDELRARLRREPSDAELLTALEDSGPAASGGRSRSHAGRFTQDDLATRYTVGVVESDVVLDTSDFLLHPAEGRTFITLFIDHVRQTQPPELGDIATAWLGGVYSLGEGAPADTAQISARLGVPVWAVRRRLVYLRDLAAQMLHERLGITVEDVDVR